MSNELKKFIEDNREEFDDKAPSGKVWENMEASFSPEKEKRSIIRPLYKWSMAAAAVLIISAGVYFMIFDKKVSPEAVRINPAGADAVTSDSFTPEMNQFVKLIDMKQEELKALAAEQPELYQKFTKDLNQLDSSYNILKNQLNAAPNQEMLLEAMVQNLQLQLSVLNQQLNIIHQIKEKKYSHEKVDQAI